MINCDIAYIVKIFYKTSNVDFIIRNMLHFNKNYNVFLLLNVAEYLYDKLNLEELGKKYLNVIIFRCKAYRTKFDPHVIQCVTNCMNYILENIQAKYIVLNHDSEVYIKQVDVDIIKNNMIQCKKLSFDKEEIDKKLNTFWWGRFKELENVFNYFMENEITPQLNVCPGLIISYETLQKINKNLNDINTEFYLGSERRVLLDEVIYYSFICHNECSYCNLNHTYWIDEKRTGLKTEEETLKEFQEDLNNNKLKNTFSIKKSYKSVCNFVENNLMKNT